MKRKRKIELAADALVLIMLIGSCQKVLRLVKEQRNYQSMNTKTPIYSSIDEENSNTNIIILEEDSTDQKAILETMFKTIKEQKMQQLDQIALIAQTERQVEQQETMPFEQEPLQSEGFSSLAPTEELMEETNSIENASTMRVATTTANVNVRTGNTTDALRITNLQVNEKVYVLFSCENNWDLVKYKDHVGYVCRDYLNYAEEEIESKYSYTPRKDIVLTTDELNFRPTPSTEVKSISRFSKDDEIEVIAEVNNGWYLVRNNGILGYVHGDYITSLLDRANEQYSELGLTELEVQKVVYVKDSADIKDGAGEEYEEIGKLEQYETLRVIKEYGEWYFAMTNDYNFGFVNKESTEELTGKFLVSDLSEQRVWLYNNNQLYYTTSETSGKDSTPSHIGKTVVDSKVSPKFLSGTGYQDQKVEYWVGINDYEEGFHDASWRYAFGKDVNYHLYGSHGCHNVAEKVMSGIYKEISLGDTVIVHK